MVMTHRTFEDCEILLASIGRKGGIRVWKQKDPMPNVGGFFFIDRVAHGGLRVFYQYRKTTGIAEISPRMFPGDLYHWLQEAGVRHFAQFLKCKQR